MAYYNIDNTLDQFNGDGYLFLMDRIIESSPDFFNEDDLETACNVESGLVKYYGSSIDEYETVEICSTSYRK